MKCEIQVKSNGRIKVNNQPLYNEILASVDNDVNRALSIYGISLTQEFKDLGIEKPTYKNLITYISQYKSDNLHLNIEDKLDSLFLGLNSDSENVRKSFLDAFDVEGTFGINLDVLENSGILKGINIIDVLDNIDYYKNLWYKLQNNPFNIPSFKGYTLSEEGVNPDFTEGRILKEYSGMNKENIMIKAQSLNDDLVLENIDKILEIISGKKGYKVYEYNPITQELLPPDITIKHILETLIETDPDYSEMINIIETLSDEVYNSDIDVFNNRLDVLKDFVQGLGIDYSGLVLTETNREEVQELLDTMFNFFTDIQNQDLNSVQGSFEEYVHAYDRIIGSSLRSDIGVRISESLNDYYTGNIDLHIEKVDLRQQDLFERHSVIKVADNIYRKVVDQPLEELYTAILNNPSLLPSGILKVDINSDNIDILVKEIDSFITNKAGEMYVNSDSNIEILKKIASHKIIHMSKPEVYTELEFEVFEDPMFESDFVSLMQEDSSLKDIFYISSQGIEAFDDIGEYTREYLKILLDEDTYRSLVNYAVMSDNFSLKGLIEPYGNVTKDSKRVYYTQNIHKLPNYNGDVRIGQDRYIINSNKDFLRLGDRLVENVGNNTYVDVGVELLHEDISEIETVSNPNIIEKPGKIEDETIEFC